MTNAAERVDPCWSGGGPRGEILPGKYSYWGVSGDEAPELGRLFVHMFLDPQEWPEYQGLRKQLTILSLKSSAIENNRSHILHYK